MGLEEIKHKILSDAQKQADDIKAKAQAEADKISRDFDKKADELKAGLDNLSKKELAALENKLFAPIQHAENVAILGKKRQLVEKTIEEAGQKISKDEKLYVEILKQQLEGLKLSENMQFCPAKGFDDLKTKLGLKLAKGKIAENLKDGFLVRAEQVEYECSLDSMLSKLKIRIEFETEKALFGKKNG